MRIIDFYMDHLGITDPEMAASLGEVSRLETLPKGHRVISIGERLEVMPLLVSGVLRGYVVDENGRDITDCLISHRGDVVIGGGDLTKPSPVNIETLTECQVVLLPLADLQPMMDCPAIMALYIHQLSEALTRHWELKMLLYQCPAMERYQWFLKRYPGLENVLSGKHLASFLGMTPVTLSRLRRKMRETV